MNTPSRMRRGFSLAEILVAIVIVAVVAAVVLPTIASQVQRADPGRLAGDASSIKSAIDQFTADVGQYPHKLTQLVSPITTTDSGAIYGKYSTSEVNRWKGPYLTKDAAAVLSTGYGATFNVLFNVDSLATTGLTEAAANQRFLTLCLSLDATSALEVDQQYDDGDVTTGLFRWKSGGSDTLKILLIPIQ